MDLTEWLNGYRRLSPGDAIRGVAEPVDDWDEPELLAPADRVRDTTPRWRLRAATVGLARPTTL